ncbi:PIN domain-containing protein [Halorhabdus rudnickae]|uniref:PIN domain-containing protein n=1 Tax=Halorhabdus rudnickae TaxID=1775544 RepID=UPI0010843D59|nr:PIN domain-containing protein [Halorhabdus rudnickae]
MATYTADAVSLLVYLVDALPTRADRLFAEAEAGETVIHTPSTAFAEVLYAVAHDKDVRGVTLTGTPEETREALVGSGPISIAPMTGPTVTEYAQIVDEFTIHDGLVVASHRARNTDAIITTDGTIREAGYDIVWG